MNNIKKNIKPFIAIFITVVVYMVLLSSLHYFGWLKLTSISKINFVAMALLAFAIGFKAGKKTSKKGYLEGLKSGSIIALVLFLVNAIFYRHFDLYVVLYYFVILASSTIGSMIGINLRH